MAIIIEGISVIVKDSAIQERFRGGFKKFYQTIPNRTHSYHDRIHRIVFMASKDVLSYIEFLKKHRLRFLENGECIDIAVVDMLKGPLEECPWLGFSRKNFFKGMTEFKRCDADFSVVWYQEPGRGYGIPCDRLGRVDIASHAGWTPDNAFQEWEYVQEGKTDSQVIELNKKEGLTQYWYSGTGEITYSGSPEIMKDGMIPQLKRLWNRVMGKD